MIRNLEEGNRQSGLVSRFRRRINYLP
jgi:hypothetical protein